MMWWFITKKQFKSELEKIRNSFNKVDDEISEIKEIRKTILTRDTINLMIENKILKEITPFYKPNSALIPPLNSELNQTKQEKRAENNFNTQMLKRANKTRPEALKTTIRGLLEKGLRTTDIYNFVVEEKRFCGKSQFYHYLSLVKQELNPELRTELQT